MGPVGPGIGIYSNIEDVVYKLYYREKDFEAKQSWIYADLLMSVGPFGPRGGIYSIIADAVYKVYFPNIRFGGPTILDMCILADDCGPCWAQRWDTLKF